jgi:hypothetical protein
LPVGFIFYKARVDRSIEEHMASFTERIGAAKLERAIYEEEHDRARVRQSASSFSRPSPRDGSSGRGSGLTTGIVLPS